MEKLATMKESLGNFTKKGLVKNFSITRLSGKRHRDGKYFVQHFPKVKSWHKLKEQVKMALSLEELQQYDAEAHLHNTVWLTFSTSRLCSYLGLVPVAVI